MVRLPGTDPLLRYNNLSIVGEVEAGTAHLLYGLMAWAFRQLFPDTAEGEYLERWADIFDVRRREATRATGRVSWPAEASRAIATDAIANRGDGVRYRVTAGALTLDGFISCAVEAIDFGARGNAAAGVQLTLQSPPNGVSPLGLVDPPGIGGGADREPDDLLLQRLLLRIREPPHGGSATDYIRWALEVPGVTRVWSAPIALGPGTVVVWFMTDDSTPDGIPSPADIARVQAYIDRVKPVTATVFVVAPVPEPLDLHIVQLDPGTPEVMAAIDTSVRALIRREAVPGGELYHNMIMAAINSAPGIRRFRLMNPPSDVTAAQGHIFVPGVTTYA